MKLTTQRVTELAERLLADYDAVRPGDAFAGDLRIELADAWQLQNAVAELRAARGEEVIGYKVGAVAPGNQKMLGLPQPVWGRLWHSEQYDSGAVLTRSNYANLAVEAEFAILLADDVLPGMSVEAIASCVDCIYPTLELHNLALQSKQPHGAELVATNCINCGVVKGIAIANPGESIETDLQLVFDGIAIDAWHRLRWPDDILAAVSWLATALQEQGLPLTRGSFVLTSAWGPPVPVAQHKTIEVTSSFFGNVSAEIN